MFRKFSISLFSFFMFFAFPSLALAYDGSFDASNASYDLSTRTLTFDISNMTPDSSTLNISELRLVGIYDVTNGQYPLDEYHGANQCISFTHCELFLGNSEGTYTTADTFQLVIQINISGGSTKTYGSNQTYTYNQLFTTSITPTPQPVSFSDDFTDADNTSLVTHDSNWTVLSGSANIQNNTLYNPETVFFDIQQSTTNQCASYEFAYPLTGRKELYLRSKDTPSLFSQHGYYFLVDDYPPGIGNFHMADELDWLGQGYSLGELSTGWHKFRGCAIGTQLSAYLDNVLIDSALARNNYAEGYPRFGISPGNYIDNFIYDNGEDILPTPTPTATPTATPTPTVTPTPTPVTVTFNASGDSYVRNGQDDHNYGAGLFMNLQSSGSNRSIVKFSQSALQSVIGSGTILSAKLRLTIVDNGNNWGATGRTVDVHRMSSSWDEGNGTESSRGTGAGNTWNCASDSNINNQAKNCSGSTEWEMGQPNNPSVHPWIQTASATQTIYNNQSGVVEYNVTSDVASFMNGTNNYGWIMKKTNEGQNGQVSFGTKESSSVPQLVVTYQP